MLELLLTCIAEGQGAGGEQGPPSLLGSPIIMMILMFGVIYFMLIRPQQKRQKDQQALRDALKRGDKVVTTGGIYGSISAIDDQLVTLEVAKDVRIRILRAQILGLQPQPQDGKTGKDKASKAKGR